MKHFLYVSWFVAALMMPRDLSAVVISSGDGTGNTTAPADDPGWANVGAIGSFSGVYLGDRWVLTAVHIGASAITLDGNSYAVEGGTSVQLQNPGGLGLTANTDLLMYRITTDPGLPSLTISSGVPAGGSSVVMIGNGRNRQTTTTFWDDATNPWTETVEASADREGYKFDTGNTMRWGENVLSTSSGSPVVSVNAGFGDVVSLFTTFDKTGETHEAQAVRGDSGGAMFFKNGASWELAGIIHAIGTSSATGQPTDSAAFQNTSFAASLPHYRNQIITVMGVPEPGEWMGVVLVMCLGAILASRKYGAARATRQGQAQAGSSS